MITRFNHPCRPTKSHKWMPAMIILAPAFILLAGALIMVLWNWLMPVLFSLAEINLWKALGLLLLSRILFGSFHHDKHHKKHHFARHRKEYADWWEKEGKEHFEKYQEQKDKV